MTRRDGHDVRGSEPLTLVLDAARAADVDAGGGVLREVDALDIMPVGSWPYDDLGALVAAELGLDLRPDRRRVHATGGEAPLCALDAAAARIARGEARIVLLGGAEGTHAVNRALRTDPVKMLRSE